MTTNVVAETHTGRPPTALAMLVFLASEALFFLTLILAYLYGRAAAPAEALAGAEKLDVARTGVFTALLIASSGTIWLAERSRTRSRQRLWLLATIALGAIFLAGQATEYAGLIGQGVTISSSLFGTQFYTLTGMHFLHVTAGVAMLAIMGTLACFGRPDEPRQAALAPIGLYWHFVDVVWIALFLIVYVAR
jgi:cytochrome c oxidase subunit III